MSSEISDINNILESKFVWLRFSDELETQFRKNYVESAVEAFKRNLLVLAVVFVLSVSFIIVFSEKALLENWLLVCGVILICLAIGCVIVRIEALNPYHQFYTGGGASIALTASTAIPYFMNGELMYALTLAASLYCIVAVYTMAKLRFINAAFWCPLSAIYTWFILDYAEVEFSLMAFNLHITVAHVFGMLLSYMNEHRERVLFLNSQLLKLEKLELNKFADQAKMDSDFQLRINQFLEAVRSDLDKDSLGANIFSGLRKNFNFDIGVLYIARNETLTPLSGYALTIKASEMDHIESGENLLGSAVCNKKMQVLNDFATDYFKIGSGLGEGKSNSILVMPILFEDTVVGGLELGSFSPFSEDAQHFLDEVKKGIGVALYALQLRERA